MKRTAVLVLLAVLLSGGLALATPVDVEIQFGCTAEVKDGALTFTAAHMAPGADSSGETCGKFWSTWLNFTVYANAGGCITFSTTDFIHQVNSSWTIEAGLDATNCLAKSITHGFLWIEMTGGTIVKSIQIGAKRSGYADHAGTYKATIMFNCSEC